MRIMPVEERLIVAADFEPDEGLDGAAAIEDIRDKVAIFAHSIKGTGVYLKVNSALRLVGYALISDIHAEGLKVFADLKLTDIPATLATDGKMLNLFKPDLLTTMCGTSPKSMKALKDQLPDTEVLGVTVLTSLTEQECIETYIFSTQPALVHFANLANKGHADGLICGPKESHIIRRRFGDRFSLSTPGIRPAWAEVKGDDQAKNRIMTPAEALKGGADRIVVGRPITQAKDPVAAVMRTLEELDKAA